MVLREDSKLTLCIFGDLLDHAAQTQRAERRRPTTDAASTEAPEQETRLAAGAFGSCLAMRAKNDVQGFTHLQRDLRSRRDRTMPYQRNREALRERGEDEARLELSKTAADTGVHPGSEGKIRPVRDLRRLLG